MTRPFLMLTLVCLATGCAPPGDSRYIALFDGRSLSGWTQRGGAARFCAEDGQIVGTTVPNTPNSFLCTERRFGDFDLTLEFRVDDDLNSGVQIRSDARPEYKSGVVHGYQVEIDPSERAWTGGIYEESGRGWLYPLDRDAAARAAFRRGEWNHMRVLAVGDGIRTWINGAPCAGLVDCEAPAGFLALQVHATDSAEPRQVRWRNIRLRDLSGWNARPPGAVVLLDDSDDLSKWRHGDVTDPPGRTPAEPGALRWRRTDGALEAVAGAGSIETVQAFADFRLHVEFAVPSQPSPDPQADGNSGVYLQKRYEVQILNSFGRPPDARECGGIYGLIAPRVHASRPAGQWQSYDITFHAARFASDGVKLAAARVTVLHNGVTIHDDVEIPSQTGRGRAEDATPGPILLQEHGSAVRFRNVWVEKLDPPGAW